MKQSWLTTFNILVICVGLWIGSIVDCEHRDDIDENSQRIEQLEQRQEETDG